MSEHGPRSTPSTQPPFLVDRTIATQKVHLVCGPVGAGRRTMTLQIASEWAQERPIFGMASHPLPFCYVTSRGSLNAIRENITGIGLDPATIPHVSMLDITRREEYTLESALDIARKCVPGVRVLFLDSLAVLCQGKINDYRDVAQFLNTADRLCAREWITVVGCMPSTKARGNEGYASPTERIFGSIAWSEMTSTKILIEPTKPRDICDPHRIVHLVVPDEPVRVLYFEFQNGKGLVPCEEIALESPLDGWLAEQEEGATFPTSALQFVADAKGVSRTGFFRWLKLQISSGTLEKVGHGEYRVTGQKATTQ